MNTPNHENGDTVETYLTHILTTIDLYSPTTTQPVLTRNHDVRTKGGTYAMDQIARGLLYKLCNPDCLVDPLCTQQEEEEEGEPMEHTSSPNIHTPEEESIPKLQNQNQRSSTHHTRCRCPNLHHCLGPIGTSRYPPRFLRANNLGAIEYVFTVRILVPHRTTTRTLSNVFVPFRWLRLSVSRGVAKR